MKRETVLPAPLIFPPPTEARGASPADALAGLPVPAAFLTADAGLSGANREWIQLLEPATREGAGWLACLDVAAVSLLRDALLRAEGQFDLTLTQGGENGRYFRVRGRFDAARGEWLSVWTDESVSMRADLALSRALMVAHEAREEVENIFDAAAEAMLMVDCGTFRILRTNPGAAQLYGYSVRDLEGRPVADLVAGSAIAGDFLRLHRDYVPLRFHRRADGSHIAVEIRIRYCTRNGREVAVLTVRDASERTRSAAVQLESDLRYRTVFDGAPFPILLLNTQGSIVDANPAAADLYRFTRDEILGQRAASLITNDLALLRLFVTRPTFLPAGAHVRKDGTRFAAETTVSYVNQRGVSLAILIVRDVTEARETVARLEEAEERWRFALEGAGDGVWDWNVRDGSFYRSPRWGEMLGYTPAESRRLAWHELIHPDDRSRVLGQMEDYLHGVVPIYEAEFRLRCKTGQYRWIAARGKAMARDVDGTPMRILGTHRDISETRSLMETLRASERLWQFALEGHGDALWDWAVETGEINVSASFATIIGYPEDRPLSGNDIWPSRLHPDDLRGAIAAFSAHLSGARPITETEFRLRMEDGSYRWIALRGKIMERDANGRSTRMIGTVRDVHDRHLSVEREKQQQRELAHAARLIHVGEMASALAHELNQPLTALRNFSAVALRRLEEPESGGEAIRGPLKMIAEQALRAGEIVHRVRGFVRKGGLVTAPVAVNEVVRDMVRFAEFDARAHSVQFVLELAEPLHPVLADQVQLEQVIGNLVKNGIEAMGESTGERVLTIRTRPLDDGTVGVCVIDRGGGLADVVRADPFAPFVTTKPDGVGLGLAICRTIVENHGGRMWVESSTSSGTTFSFCLPVVAV